MVMSSETVLRIEVRLPQWWQGLTLVHFSAQRKCFRWDWGCMQGLFRGCLGGVKGHYGVFRVYFVSKMAQVELKSGRV